MFCPNCGNESESANRYCKRCGEWLPDAKSRVEFGGTSPEQSMKVMLLLNALSAAVSLLVAAMLFIGRADIPSGDPTVLIAAALSLTAGLWQLSNLFIALKQRKRFRQRRAETQAAGGGLENERAGARPFVAAGKGGAERALNPADTSELIGARHGGASVVDHTTELLQPAERRRASREGEG